MLLHPVVGFTVTAIELVFVKDVWFEHLPVTVYVVLLVMLTYKLS